MMMSNRCQKLRAQHCIVIPTAAAGGHHFSHLCQELLNVDCHPGFDRLYLLFYRRTIIGKLQDVPCETLLKITCHYAGIANADVQDVQ
jgi:hypothetical protein